MLPPDVNRHQPVDQRVFGIAREQLPDAVRNPVRPPRLQDESERVPVVLVQHVPRKRPDQLEGRQGRLPEKLQFRVSRFQQFPDDFGVQLVLRSVIPVDQPFADPGFGGDHARPGARKSVAGERRKRGVLDLLPAFSADLLQSLFA
ncbi:Protein of unknown function [Thermobacillus xylanilyticus]|uniref:Uncharacterized protein n=1 Tax=Thermobacillus xylanilyticus TaxID=76633 RepID=A0ABM8V1N4_THEXY|nr:Protein of unknown function [Thermobacillus xylanilyticus]